MLQRRLVVAAGDFGLSAVDPSSFLSDTSYSGLADSSFGFSGDSALEDNVGIQSPLQLDTSDGETILSSYDLYNLNSPPDSLALSGVTDPPFMSASMSTPNPNGSPLSDNTSAAMGFLSKVGSTFASLVGGTSRAVSPSPMPLATMRIGSVSQHSINGTTVAILLIIIGASAFLILNGSE